MKNRFSIRELEQFSGIKAHTIRTWEVRYGLLQPERTDTNLRFYTLDDVKQLLKVALLCKAGMKISGIIGLSASALEEQLAGINDDSIKKEKAVSKLIIAMFANATEEFEMILDGCVLGWGIDATVNKVILPFLERVNLLSYNDTRNYIHFSTAAIRRKLILGIEKISFTQAQKKSALLFLPKGEHYDLILLYLDYTLRTLGIKTFYLGTNIGLENVEEAAAEKEPDFLITYLPLKTEAKHKAYIKTLRQQFTHNIIITAALEIEGAAGLLSGANQIIHYREIEKTIHGKSLLQRI